MANNRIQIKRSTSNATVTGLQPGELAFTGNGNVFYIGNPADGATVRIGGLQVPGTLTANQALVANATSGIDKVIVANLVPTTVWANGAAGSAGEVLHSNGSAVYWAVDNDGVTSVATGNGLVGGTITTTGTVSVLANNGIIANSTGVYVDGANGISVTADGVNVLAGNSQLISNASGVFVNSASLSIATSQLTGDVALGTQTSGNYVATVAAGNGMVVSGSGSETAGVTVSVLANTGVVSNSTGIFIGQAVGTTSNVTFANVVTTLLSVNGNTALGDSTSDVVSITARVNTSIIPASNITYDLGNSLLRFKNVYASHVESSTAEFSGNISVGGDLIVTGNISTLNVSSLSVSDPLIKLATNNNSSDLLYIGFAGHYNGSGNATNHTGLFREPSNKNYYLFSTYGDEAKVGNNEIVITDPSFTLANLNAYLLSGGLVTNATNVTVTANSTVAVSVTANVITLSGRSNQDVLITNSSGSVTGLALGTSGYVLQSNGSALVYDTLDGGTF
jgi:hypothetical protein